MPRGSLKVICENDKTVGIDYLRWNTWNSSVKICKFICQLTSPGVAKAICNHIIDFIDCPDQRLRETFMSKRAYDNGITRLVATIFNYSTHFCGSTECYDPIIDCLETLEEDKNYISEAPFYEVSIPAVWIKLTK